MQPYYAVFAMMKGGDEIEVMEETQGHEYHDKACAAAVEAHKRYFGKAWVVVVRDGEDYRHVKHFPGDLSTSRVIEIPFCLHPSCGQIPPEQCYCKREE